MDQAAIVSILHTTHTTAKQCNPLFVRDIVVLMLDFSDQYLSNKSYFENTATPWRVVPR